MIVEERKVLLVKRKNPPSSEMWTLPGGLVKVGERVHEALIREVLEECNIKIKPVKLLDVVDYIEKDSNAKIRFHYVIIDFQAQYLGGSLTPGSDVKDARWYLVHQLNEISIPQITRNFLNKFLPSILNKAC